MRRSTLTRLLVLAAPLMIAACATIGPPQPPSLELPKPPTDLRAVRKGDRVTLTWTIPSVTTDRQTVRIPGPTRICRGLTLQLTQCGTPVGEATASVSPSSPGASSPAAPRRGLPSARSSRPRVEESYTDTLPNQITNDDLAASIAYAIEALNTGGRGAGLSNQVRVPLVRTLPPPQDFAARVTSAGIVLTWSAEVPPADAARPLRYVYRVYRRPEGSKEQILAGEIPARSERNFTFTDANIDWEKTYEYHADTVTVITQANSPEVQVEGDDTAEVKVFADDVFPPAVPSGLQAVASGPGQKTFVDLVWAPVSDVDLDGYNVYRHESGTAAVKVSAALLKTPSYRDDSVSSGKNYFYSVSAVDVRGNESALSEEAGEAVP
jgi:hypothetical protein